jgi:hypothetical protein
MFSSVQYCSLIYVFADKINLQVIFYLGFLLLVRSHNSSKSGCITNDPTVAMAPVLDLTTGTSQTPFHP